MSEEFILKACKSIQRRVDIITEKLADILGKFTALCLFSNFLIYFLRLKLILFYNRDFYYYSRIFLVLLPHPVYNLRVLVISVVESVRRRTYKSYEV